MKYTADQAKEKIQEIGYKIHHHQSFHDVELENMIEEVHEYIRYSDITYMEAYIAVKGIAASQGQFNESMQRIRETIYKRKYNL